MKDREWKADEVTREEKKEEEVKRSSNRKELTGNEDEDGCCICFE